MTETLARNEDRIASPQGVAQKHQAAAQTQVPEDRRDDALPAPLRGDPLHEEAGGEEGLPSQADGYPDVFGRE